jgi:hypothetical protein
VQPLWKIVWKRLKKLKIELPYDPSIQLLGIYPKQCKLDYNKGTCTPMLSTAFFMISKLETAKMPITDEWIKKMWYLYTMEFYSAIKN